jgi:hypothetical protein
MKEIMRDQPLARLGRSDEIAAAVFWLCSPGGSFVLLRRLGQEAAVELAVRILELAGCADVILGIIPQVSSLRNT